MAGDTNADLDSRVDAFVRQGRRYQVRVSGKGDADCNGTVNFADVTEVLANFNSPCN